jgi:hypothetical protein
MTLSSSRHVALDARFDCGNSSPIERTDNTPPQVSSSRHPAPCLFG